VGKIKELKDEDGFSIGMLLEEPWFKQGSICGLILQRIVVN